MRVNISIAICFITVFATLSGVGQANAVRLPQITELKEKPERPRAPPLFHVRKANDLYQAGYDHGRQAQTLIAEYIFTVKENIDLLKFIEESELGRVAFRRMVELNTRVYPQYVEEMRGISDGARVPMKYIWMINLLQELNNLVHQDKKSAKADGTKYEHCSDFMSEKDGKIAHGHNEDWSNDVRPYVYFVAYHFTKESGRLPVAGLCYPGMIIGNAVTFNNKGMTYTQNALTPQFSRVEGLSMNFVQRLCVETNSFKECEKALATPGQIMGYNLNVVSCTENLAGNIEVWEDSSSVQMLSRNISHFNDYKHLKVPSVKGEQRTKSTDWRQLRSDALPPVRSGDDIISRLGDTEEKHYPIYTPTTLITYLLDAATGDVTIWANSNPAHSKPVYRWNIYTFFEE